MYPPKNSRVHKFLKEWAPTWSATAASISAIAASLALLVTAKLAANSDASLEASTRAYVAVLGARFDEIPIAGKNVFLRVEFKNVGKASAEDLSHVAVSSTQAFDFKPDDAGLPWIHEGTTAWPRIQTCLYNRPAPLGRPVYPDVRNEMLIPIFNLGPELFPQKIIDGRASFVVAGCFVYRTFGKARASPYCFYFQPRRGGGIHDGTFEWCPSGSSNPT